MSTCLKHMYEFSNMTFLEQIEAHKILENYDLCVTNVDRVRSAFKVTSNNGCFCLKKIGNGEKRAIKSISIMEYLRAQGFDKVTRPFYTSSGEILVKRKSSTYYLTNWIDAYEIGFDDINHIFESTQLLAEFHNKAKGFQSKAIQIKSRLGKMPALVNDKVNFLIKIKEYLEQKTDKTDFDSLYYEFNDYYIHQAQYAANILKHSDYDMLCEKNKKELYICHDSFYYQNILKDESGNYFLIDLESCLYDLPLVDIGNFIRRIMTDKKSLWDFDLCRRMLLEYGNIRKMDEKEYKVILSMIAFPYKFYKIGKKKYLKKKKWKDERFNRKLERILQSRETQEKFIEKYIKYYDIKL